MDGSPDSTPRIKRPKVSRVPLHMVVWEDAAYHDESVPGTAMAVTFGILLEDTPERVTLAGEVFDDGTYRRHTSIPKGMVRRILKIKSVQVPEFDKEGER